MASARMPDEFFDTLVHHLPPVYRVADHRLDTAS